MSSVSISVFPKIKILKNTGVCITNKVIVLVAYRVPDRLARVLLEAPAIVQPIRAVECRWALLLSVSLGPSGIPSISAAL